MLATDYQHGILVEALGLVASYLYAQTVELSAHPIGENGRADPETYAFMSELQTRHALACALSFQQVVQRIERDYSETGTITRAESKAVIRGRLDVPMYISTRFGRRDYPRTYPLLISDRSPSTPENQLVCEGLKGLVRQLARSQYPRTTAEGRITIEIYGWLQSRIRRDPWAAVTGGSGHLEHLRRATAQRIRKRQTANGSAYSSLLDWVNEWTIDLERLGTAELRKIAGGILAFPPSDFFWNKVFEIWCLKKTAQALEESGCRLIQGPMPLHTRARGPIYRFAGPRTDTHIQVLFQRQSPLGAAHWHYQHSGVALAGIPDVVLFATNLPPLVIDAKYRWGSVEGRSEEVYKMLGYAENFRAALHDPDLQAILIFPGPEPASLDVRSSGQGHVWVVSTGLDPQGLPPLLKTPVELWLALGKRRQQQENAR